MAYLKEKNKLTETIHEEHRFWVTWVFYMLRELKETMHIELEETR